MVLPSISSSEKSVNIENKKFENIFIHKTYFGMFGFLVMFLQEILNWNKRAYFKTNK